MYFCLPNITNPMHIEQLREMVPPPSQNTVGVCKPITLLILYSISSRLVTLLKIIDTTLKDSDTFDITVSFKFTNLRFQIFLLLLPEMSTGFTSYTVQIICVSLVWIL